MHPLKILAFAIGVVPLTTFVLTLILTDGAPLRAPKSGEESEPAAATRVLPQNQLARHTSAAAADHPGFDMYFFAQADIEIATSAPGPAETDRLVNHERDATVFMTLFGDLHPSAPTAP